MRKIFILITVIFSLNSQCYSENIGIILRNDFKATGGDYQQLFKSLGNTELEDLATPLGILFASVITSTADELLRDYMAEHKSQGLTNYTDLANYGGEPLVMAVLPGAIYLTGLALGEESLRDAGRLGYESILLSGLVTTSIKMVVGRRRPFVGEGNYSFDMFSSKDRNNSFPSGHSTVAFALATVFANQTGKTWAYPVFYSLAFSTAFARVYKDKHWLSDVVAGAGIGTVSALAMINANENRKNESIIKGNEINMIDQKNGIIVPNNFYIPIYSYSYSW